jgi:hypothetical protein
MFVTNNEKKIGRQYQKRRKYMRTSGLLYFSSKFEFQCDQIISSKVVTIWRLKICETWRGMKIQGKQFLICYTERNEIKRNETKPIETKSNETTLHFVSFRFDRFRFVLFDGIIPLHPWLVAISRVLIAI